MNKAELLVVHTPQAASTTGQTPLRSEIAPSPLGRRTFLRRTSTATTAAVVGGGFLAPHQAHAVAWVPFIARAAAASLISWYVDRTMDKYFPPSSLSLAATSSPTPTNDEFHNRHAARWEVEPTEKTTVEKSKIGECRGYNVYISLHQYIGAYDLNEVELMQMKKEFSCSSTRVAVPVTLRRSICSASVYRQFQITAQAYGLDPRTVRPDYSRVYWSQTKDRAGNDIMYPGFGLTATHDSEHLAAGSKAHLLMVA